MRAVPAAPADPDVPTRRQPGDDLELQDLLPRAVHLARARSTLTGTNYFASGIYYFERPISIAAGATVVFGEGKYRGCVFDTDAALRPDGAPKGHEITGKGATILLGKGANDHASPVAASS